MYNKLIINLLTHIPGEGGGSLSCPISEPTEIRYIELINMGDERGYT